MTETISGRTSGETCIAGAEGLILSGRRTGEEQKMYTIYRYCCFAFFTFVFNSEVKVFNLDFLFFKSFPGIVNAGGRVNSTSVFTFGNLEIEKGEAK
ncbi:MAG: hypothetical protein APF76_00355 [Desulfitibacter sp. BRH_c19]|nr:MAG: hypothetical protein APF76_00355 [Desulfitibacter sp. BRH_c19]